MAGFVDEAQVHVKGGDGGAGAVAFRREAHVAKGGPDGGNGGRGGSVILEATHQVVSLLAFRDHPHRRAENGGHGSGGRRHGRNGADLVVAVPEGTVVRTLDGEVLADLAHHGDRLVAAEGGRGGRGNASFLSNRLRAPAFAEQGEYGVERWLDLELKLFADVAIVGFPNVGKSTLVSRLSAARPRIADYPFTTLEPHLGVVRLPGPEPAEFILADIPGLIEGASEGRGLGFQFLRHIERARVLLVLVDLAPFAPMPAGAQVEVLLGELRRYRADLLDRPRVIVGSRVDLATHVQGDAPAMAVSALTGEGLDALQRVLGEAVGAARAAQARSESEPVVHRPGDEAVVVVRSATGFEVLGRRARRAVALSDLGDADALALAHRRLRRLGVDRALERAGARAGDVVRIGDLEFEWEPEQVP